MNSVTKKWQEMANERLMLMQKLSAQHAKTAKLKALNGELTSALRLICAASTMTEAKIAVMQANTLLQSEAAK